MTTITPDSVRAAMGLLRWGFTDLAKASEVGENTVARFMRGETVRDATRDKLGAAIEAAGVELFNGNRPGARMRG